MLGNLTKVFKKDPSSEIVTTVEEVFHNPLMESIELDGWGDQSTEYDRIYDWFTFYFKNKLPVIFQIHRQYFNTEKRGYGEDAFHALWFLLFQKYRPSKILEIGIYRGQTLSYFTLLGKYFNYPVDVQGISPLDNSGDSYSDYKKIDYREDIIFNFSRFNLGKPVLHKGYSNDPKMQDLIRSNSWDLIYIDGSHDYEVVKADIEICLASLNKNGVMVLDDSSLYLDLMQSDRFKGHPGPSKACEELVLSGRCNNIINVGHNRVFIKL
jgi:hypothetical protein